MSDQKANPSPAQFPSTPQVHLGRLTPSQDPTPAVINARCPTPDQVSVTYNGGVDRSDISAYAIRVLTEICSRACISSVAISSGARTPDSQARIMYDNARTNLAAQRRLYGRSGNMALDQYEKGIAQGLDAATIRSNMTNVIKQHLDDFHHVQRAPNLSVFDVSPRSIRGSDQQNAGQRLATEARLDPRVVRFFQPPNDPGYHFEIQGP